jgi:O-antigen ligase
MDEDANSKLLHRPGGFLNANMTAAIAMIWFFIMMEVNKDSAIILKGLALLLTLSICMLTQSRAAMLFLASYALYTLIVSRNVKFLMAIVFVAMVSLAVSHYFELVMVQDIVDNFTSRADRNNSSTLERLSVLAYAIKSFFDAPVFGNGYRYVAKTEGHGLSSHNQVAEILTNFGLVGFVIIITLYITFYHKNSFSYLSLCIFPTMFFSHNFFENSSYQVVLAFAYYGYDKAQEKTRGNRIVKEMQ